MGSADIKALKITYSPLGGAGLQDSWRSLDFAGPEQQIPLSWAVGRRNIKELLSYLIASISPCYTEEVTKN